MRDPEKYTSMEAVTELDRSMEDAEKYSAKMETNFRVPWGNHRQKHKIQNEK